jgi:parvulin-like peptidyl-prolyl isomerase
VADDEAAAALDQITGDLGGPEALAAWLAANLYTEDQFSQALRRDLLRAKMAQQVTAQIDERAEQVHAREILVADQATAQSLLEKLQGGADFATLAAAYSLDASSRPAGGDLGWFPRGLLTVAEVETAAFNLQPGERSEVLQSALGYHIVEVLERQPARPLTPGALQALRERTFSAWLERVLAEAEIERFISP